MSALPRGRMGQVLAAGLLVLVLLVIWLAALQPLTAVYADQEDRIAQRGQLARRMANVAASLPELERLTEAASARGAATPAMLQGASDGVAGAALQQMIQDMAARTGTTLSSTEALPAEAASGYRIIAVRAALAAPWPVLVQLVQAIGDASPRLLIDDLQIHGTRRVGGGAEPPMDASLTVLGFRVASP